MKPVLSTMVAGMLIRAEQLESFQMRLNDMGTGAERKAAIVAAGSDGFLTRDEATLLVQAYALEAE
jgi:hypothetical protein